MAFCFIFKPKISLLYLHSFVWFVVIRCTPRCHSLSLAVTCSHSFLHSLSLATTRCTTRLSFYKRTKQNLGLLQYPKFRWNFAAQNFSKFTQEKHKNVASLIIIYVVVRQCSLCRCSTIQPEMIKNPLILSQSIESFFTSFPVTCFFLQWHFDLAYSSGGENINIKRWN